MPNSEDAEKSTGKTTLLAACAGRLSAVRQSQLDPVPDAQGANNAAHNQTVVHDTVQDLASWEQVRNQSTNRRFRTVHHQMVFAWSQTIAKNEHTSEKAGKAASKVLKDGRTGKDSKTAAGSALSQRPDKKRSNRWGPVGTGPTHLVRVLAS